MYKGFGTIVGDNVYDGFEGSGFWAKIYLFGQMVILS